MKKNNVVQFEGRDENTDLLTQLIQTGARQLLAQAIEAGVSVFLAQFQDRTRESGRAAVVRNGHQPERDIQTGIGPISVKVPNVRSRNGEPVTFSSALVPPFVRRTQSLEAALPWLYLKGISSGDTQSALEVLVGPEAKGLSAARFHDSSLYGPVSMTCGAKPHRTRISRFMSGLTVSIPACAATTASCVR